MSGKFKKQVPTQFASVSFYHSDVGVAARAALKAQYEQETQLLNDPSTPLQDQLNELELEAMAAGSSGSNGRGHHLHQHHFAGGQEILQIDDEDRIEDDGEHGASGVGEEEDEEEEIGARARDDVEGKLGLLMQIAIKYTLMCRIIFSCRRKWGSRASVVSLRAASVHFSAESWRSLNLQW